MRFQPNNKHAKHLTAEDVLDIRTKYLVQGGYTYDSLSMEFGVSSNSISNIVKGITWKFMAGYELIDLAKPPQRPTRNWQPHSEPEEISEELKAKMLTRLDEPPKQRLDAVAAFVNKTPIELPKALTAEQPQGPSWYDLPPPVVPGEESVGLGLSRLEREAKDLPPQVGNELDKLEKGD